MGKKIEASYGREGYIYYKLPKQKDGSVTIIITDYRLKDKKRSSRLLEHVIYIDRAMTQTEVGKKIATLENLKITKSQCNGCGNSDTETYECQVCGKEFCENCITVNLCKECYKDQKESNPEFI